MAHIQVLGTGGTIASRGGGAGGAVAVDTVADVVPLRYGSHTISVRDILTAGSYRLDLADLRRIAESVRDALAEDDAAAAGRVDGVVVTHGTDTLEETAFLLDLVHTDDRPVVVTGAQRPADSPDPDGPRNVREAVFAAADQRLRGTGVLICFDGTVRSARGARKAHTTASSPFDGGIEVAHMAGDELVVTAVPARPAPLPMPAEAFDDVRVEIVTSYPGATPELFEAALRLGADGIVLAGSGIGNAGPGFADAVARATAQGRAVVLSSRTPWGPVVPVYGDGGGVDLVAAGAIPSGDLNPYQARILVALLLSLGTATADLPAAFRRHTQP